jgi:hypothetical protein
VVTQLLVAGMVAAVLTVQLALTAHRVYAICTRPAEAPASDNDTAAMRPPAGALP